MSHRQSIVLSTTVLLAYSVGCVSNLPTSTSASDVPAIDAQLRHSNGTYYLDDQALTKPVVTALAMRVQILQQLEASDPDAHPFDGVLTVQVPPDETLGVLRPALVSATQAGFHTAWLVVSGTQGERKGVKISLRRPQANTQVAAKAHDDTAPTSHYANPTVGISPSLGFNVSVFDTVYDTGEGLSLACPLTPCTEAGWPTLELTRLARRLKLDHPGDRSVLFRTDDALTVQAFVSTLDAMRDDTNSGVRRVELFSEAILHHDAWTP